ncbi:MAG: hypothetical protein AAFW81_03000 [Pseudomonadota bacterium]
MTEILLVSFGVATAALVLAAALSPIETLSWWAGWTDRDATSEPQGAAPTDKQRAFIVYLSGVAALSGEYMIARERIFLRRLGERLPDAAIVTEVFPYSPSGAPLLATPRLFDRLWRWLQKLRLQERRSVLKSLINLRNIYQVMVSADHRYGPIFSQGAADVIESALWRAGYSRGSPVFIIGYSGGAQVAVGAAPFLAAQLDCAIDVISVGGVIASDPGLASLRKLHHFAGARDRIEKVGAVMFAERWALMANSHWNRAKRAGRISINRLAGITHAGPQGYFGLPKLNGVSNNETMADAVAAIVFKSGEWSGDGSAQSLSADG